MGYSGGRNCWKTASNFTGSPLQIVTSVNEGSSFLYSVAHTIFASLLLLEIQGITETLYCDRLSIHNAVLIALSRRLYIKVQYSQ